MDNQIQSTELVQLICTALDEKKAENIVTLDLRNKGTLFDYMIIATAMSGRQSVALADYVTYGLKQKGCEPISVEGLTQGDWVLIDGGDVVVHVFKPESRAFYNLEKMWGIGSLSSTEYQEDTDDFSITL
ncbi:MAG: ribosome silencing factor [Alphaproteobacteria bacterium]|nr:ribosome silencing factor [Alphaproteobacteria bacterium]